VSERVKDESAQFFLVITATVAALSLIRHAARSSSKMSGRH
jgi:hypothetical protein